MVAITVFLTFPTPSALYPHHNITGRYIKENEYKDTHFYNTVLVYTIS